MIYIFQVGDVNIRRRINETTANALVEYNYTINEFSQNTSPYIQGDSQTRDTIYSTLTYTIQGQTDLETIEKLTYLVSSRDNNYIPVFGLKVLNDSPDLSDNAKNRRYQIVYNLCRVIKEDTNNEDILSSILNPEERRDQFRIKIKLVCKSTSFHNIEETLNILKYHDYLNNNTPITFESVFNTFDIKHFIDKESIIDFDYYICLAESRLFSKDLSLLDLNPSYASAPEDPYSAVDNYLMGQFALHVDDTKIDFNSKETLFSSQGGSIYFNPIGDQSGNQPSTAYRLSGNINNIGTKLADKAILHLSSRYTFTQSLLGSGGNAGSSTQGFFRVSGDYFEIYNKSTNTGFRIKWNINRMSPIMYYKIHTSELFIADQEYLNNYGRFDNTLIAGDTVTVPAGTNIGAIFIDNHLRRLSPKAYTSGVQASLNPTEYSYDISTGIIYLYPFGNANSAVGDTTVVGKTIHIVTNLNRTIVSADQYLFDGKVTIENISDFNNQLFTMSGIDNNLDELYIRKNTKTNFTNDQLNLANIFFLANSFKLYVPGQYIQN